MSLPMRISIDQNEAIAPFTDMETENVRRTPFVKKVLRR